VAVKASREFVVDAPPEVVMEALTDVGVLSSWSPLHKHIEVIDRYPDGRPHHVKTKIRILGLVDKEILEYHWGPDWVVYDVKGTAQQHGQHVEYNLKPEGIDKTRVRFDITVEPAGPIPQFVVKRATENVLNAAVKGLSDLVMGGGDSDKPT
jgi:carbon monoxide dehydrogenase subunit G